MRILIVGAGAVGTVLATTLGGSHDIVLGSRRGPMQVHGAFPLSRRSARADAAVVTTRALDDVAEGHWDAVILTGAVSETEDVVAHISAAHPAPLFGTVSQVPSEIRRLRSLVGAERLVVLAPGFLAVRGESSAGTGYWVPPRSPLVTVSGAGAGTVRTWFTQAGTRAKVGELRDILAQAALTMPFMAELTILGGDWDRLARQPGRALAGAREARAAVGAPIRVAPPTWTVGLALRAVPTMVPFDFRTYAAEHFARQRRQTETLLEDWIEAGSATTPVLAELLVESRTTT